MRDVLGNPFRPVAFDRKWLARRGGLVLKLAREIEAQQDFDRLPELADALEAVACTDRTLMDHLRSPDPHYKGCWALELTLDRT